MKHLNLLLQIVLLVVHGCRGTEPADAVPWEAPDEWLDAPGCQCCTAPQDALDQLTRHCLAGTFMQADQVLTQNDIGVLAVSDTVKEKVCGSPTCRGAILRYWSTVRGCSEVSKWRTVGMAWMAVKTHCSQAYTIPTEGSQYFTLMRATFRANGVNASMDYSMRRAESEVAEALAATMGPNAGGDEERFQVSVAPMEPLVRQAAMHVSVEKPACVELEATLPSQDSMGVLHDLDFVAFSFMEQVVWDTGASVRIRGKTKACADIDLGVDEGQLELMPKKVLLFRMSDQLIKGCCYSMEMDFAAAMAKDGERGLCRAPSARFCVERDAPVPRTKLAADRWLRTIFDMPVKSFAQAQNFTIESKSLVGPGSPYRAALPFRATRSLIKSQHMAWVYSETGTLLDQADTAQVKTNADGTGIVDGKLLKCTYSQQVAEAAVPCDNLGNFEVDVCKESGRCSEANQLPCGLEVTVKYPKGLVLGVSGDRSTAAEDIVRTRQCGPPLLASARWPKSQPVQLSWSEPVEVVSPTAKLWLCELDTEERKCLIEGKRIDQAVRVNASVGYAAEWELPQLEGSRPVCGRLEVIVGEDAVQSTQSKVSNNLTRTEISMKEECPRFLDPEETNCWLLWDKSVRFLGTKGPAGGSDNLNFRRDLDDTGILYTVINDVEEVWRRFRTKTYMPWCVIVPGLSKNPAIGHQKELFDYVSSGGQLYVIGGRVNVDFVRSIFDLEMALTLSGNRQVLEQTTLNKTLHGSGWFKELPTLNQMACVSFPTMQGTTHGESVVVHGIYTGREEASDDEQVNGYCLFEVTTQLGVAEYIAFDWHVEDTSARKKWATTLAMLLEGNSARKHAPRRLQATASPSRSWYPLLSQVDLPMSTRRHPVDISSRRLQDKACPVAEGRGDNFELTISFRCPSGLTDQDMYLGAGEGPESCDQARESFMQSIADSQSAFHKFMQSRCTSLEVLNYSLPEVVEAVSLCPDSEKVADAIFDMNFACNFSESTGLSLNRFLNSTAYLEARIAQTRDGLETFDDVVRDKICRRSVCRQKIDEAYQLTMSCPTSAGRRGFVAHIVAIARTALKSCTQVQSLASVDEAVAGAVAPGLFGLRGVASGTAVERTQIVLGGLNTASPEEMNAVHSAVKQIVGEKLGLLDTSVDAWTATMAGAAFGLKYGDVTQTDAQVAVRLEPAANDQAAIPEAGQLTGEEPIIQETMFNGSGTKNLHVMTLQPKWASVGVDPSADISITFEDLIAKDDREAVVRIFPVALREVCLYLTEYGQFAFFPTETGSGSLRTAGKDETPPDVAVPVKFVCQSYPIGDEAAVVVSGETLHVRPKYPLMRDTEYAVILPRRAVKASDFASNKFQGAKFNGWPSDGSPEDEDYVFSTGSPDSSNTKVSVAVSCGSEAECAARRSVLDSGMEDVSIRTQCFIAWFRCSSDTSSTRYCEQPDGMDWCQVGAHAWSTSMKPAVPPALVLGGASMADMRPSAQSAPSTPSTLHATGSTVRLATLALLLCLPWWAWACAVLSWVLCAFAGYRAVQWICEAYRKSRMYDPYVCQVTRYLPFWATLSVILLIFACGFLGAHAAESTYQHWTRPLSREMMHSQSEEWIDVHYFRGRGLCSFTLAACASTAIMSAVASGVTARFRMCYHDLGQAAALASAALAFISVLASACGFVQGSGISESVAMQTSFTWTVAAAMLSVGVAGVSTVLLALPVGLLVLYSRPGIGEIVVFACRFIFNQYTQWNDESGPIAAWSGWVLHMRDIKGMRGFIHALHRKQKYDGSVYLSFRVSDSPVSAIHTRSVPLQQHTDSMAGVHSFLGETVSLNISSPLTLVTVDVMYQQKVGEQPEKVASATWDPWCGALLDKCLSNWKVCNPQNLRNVLWNPRDLLGANGQPESGTYVGFELNLSSDPVSYNPDMGILAFSATHMGPMKAAHERDSPWDPPQRTLTLGDTVDERAGSLRRRAPAEASAPFYSRVMYSQYGRLPRDLKAEAGASYLRSIAPGGTNFASHRGGSTFWTH